MRRSTLTLGGILSASTLAAVTVIGGAGAAGASSDLVGSLDVFGSLGTGPTCAEESSQVNPNGWGVPFDDEQGHDPEYVDNDRLDELDIETIDDDGSLLFSTVDSDDDRNSIYYATETPAADLIEMELGFTQHRPAGADPLGNATLQIRADGADVVDDNSDIGFVTFVWGGTTDGANDAAGSEEWWATRALGEGDNEIPRAERRTLDELVEAAGDETVVRHYGVSVIHPDARQVAVDEIVFGDCTTNFVYADEPVEPVGSVEGFIGSIDVGGSLAGLFSS